MELIKKNAYTKICYSCENNLTGTEKEYYDRDYGYISETWDCRCEEVYTFFCPRCESDQKGSNYLENVINDEHVL